MSGRYSDHDVEHYERPRRRTRPRTKERPSYDDAEDGVVVTVDRGLFTLLLDGRLASVNSVLVFAFWMSFRKSS